MRKINSIASKPKVSGSGDLIGRLIADAALETVSLLF